MIYTQFYGEGIGLSKFITVQTKKSQERLANIKRF